MYSAKLSCFYGLPVRISRGHTKSLIMTAGLGTENQPTEAWALFTQSRRSASFCIIIIIIIIIIIDGKLKITIYISFVLQQTYYSPLTSISMSSITITAYCTVFQWCQQHTDFRKKCSVSIPKLFHESQIDAFSKLHRVQCAAPYSSPA
jgi:hypothetical protein